MNTYKDTHNVNNRKTFFSNPDCYIDYEIIASGFQQARRKASMETARLGAFLPDFGRVLRLVHLDF